MHDKPIEPDVMKTLTALEESLWRAETRYDAQFVDTVFAADFFEFGRSGKTYTRSEMMPGEFEPNGFNATLPLGNFNARYLAQDLVQVTYVSEVAYGDDVQFANRSSLWSCEDGGWKLRFHQGTPTDPI